MASDGAALGIIFDNLGKTSKYPNISKLLLFSTGAFADAKAVLTETTKKKKVCEDAGIHSYVIYVLSTFLFKAIFLGLYLAIYIHI